MHIFFSQDPIALLPAPTGPSACPHVMRPRGNLHCVAEGIEIVSAIMHSACHGYNDPAVEVIVPSLHIAKWTGIMMYASMYIDIPYMLLSHVFFVGYVVVRIVMGFVVIPLEYIIFLLFVLQNEWNRLKSAGNSLKFRDNA
ncbi:hypothetical protein GGX14DRAFT_401356 [Mycena pura]|uniref:Transmembrane protein n=1 Tax=Mycena pura TaxID=153505 RepID=A0AAD6V4B5_9AGAR|nr:hypothetical protein GGX14DRAFT_401356 [Mycena pura]